MCKQKKLINTEPMPEQKPVNYDTRKIHYKEYKEYRSQIIGLRDQLHQTYDKALLTISTGSVVVSFTYILQVDGIDYHRYLWMMIFSWILFASSIILGLYGHRISCKSNDEAVDISDYNYDNKVGDLTLEGWDKLCELKESKAMYDRNIAFVNNAQLYLIPFGMFFFALFVFISLGTSKPNKPEKIIYCYKEECMLQNDKTKNTTTNKEDVKNLVKENGMTTHDEPRSLLTGSVPKSNPQPEVSNDKGSSKEPEEESTTDKSEIINE